MLAKRAQRQRALTWQRDREAQRQRQRQQCAKAVRRHHGGAVELGQRDEPWAGGGGGGGDAVQTRPRSGGGTC